VHLIAPSTGLHFVGSKAPAAHRFCRLTLFFCFFASIFFSALSFLVFLLFSNVTSLSFSLDVAPRFSSYSCSLWKSHGHLYGPFGGARHVYTRFRPPPAPLFLLRIVPHCKYMFRPVPSSFFSQLGFIFRLSSNDNRPIFPSRCLY